jgi:sigma-B regulation protein RsbU (phosphoserine phosphatase)
MDGYEVCRRLKADTQTAPIPVIFVTAEDQTEDLVNGFQAGGVDYIAKPFREEEVMMRVRNALYTQHLFNENRAYQEKMERELQTAHDMQMGLMPTAAPEIAGYEIAGRCLPAEHVGGDFFQYFERDSMVSLCVADVTGHAMEAAIPVVLFSGMLETQMESNPSLQELFWALNRSVHRILDARTRVCFQMAQLDVEGGILRLGNAGCPYPYHYRAQTREVVELGIGAYPLGATADTDYQTLEIAVAPGDRMVFFSDGLVEATDATGEIFGYDRLVDTIGKGGGEGLSADSLLQYIADAVGAFENSAPVGDDQTCVALAVRE